MSELITIVIIGFIIYGIVILRKKNKRKFMASPQYKIYLEVLEAVENGGYEIVKSSSWQSIVKRDSEKSGLIFVVKQPFYPEDNYGCGCLVSLIPGIKDALDSIRGWSNYASMVSAVRTIQNSRKRGIAYWPDGSLVGGYTAECLGFKYDEDWIKILASVI